MPLHIALASAAAARALDDDLPPLIDALQQQGAQVTVVDWDDAAIDWSCFDLVLLRSTWDYTGRLEEFLAWVDRVARATTVLNPSEVVRWSSDKHYLADLERSGIAIVPSRFVEPGEEAFVAWHAFLAAFPDTTDVVVKPCVGAGSRDARRHGRDETAAAVAHVEALLAAQRSVLLQPYLDRVDQAGETALLFFDGDYSHAIRKGPLLRRGEDATGALFAPEQITSRQPADDERALAQRVLASIPQAQRLLYARVDLIRAADGTPCVLELELVEPSLFFAQAEGSAMRFASAVLRRAAAVRALSPDLH